MEAELLTEEGHVVRFLSKPKVALLRWRSTLEQRSEPPRIREKQKEENKQGWREVAGLRSKEKGSPRATTLPLKTKSCLVLVGFPPPVPTHALACGVCLDSWVSLTPGAQSAQWAQQCRQLNGGAAQSVCVCGQGTTLPPRARDYRQHSWESQNASEGSRRIQQCNCLTLINRVYFTFF